MIRAQRLQRDCATTENRENRRKSGGQSQPTTNEVKRLRKQLLYSAHTRVLNFIFILPPLFIHFNSLSRSLSLQTIINEIFVLKQILWNKFIYCAELCCLVASSLNAPVRRVVANVPFVYNCFPYFSSTLLSP